MKSAKTNKDITNITVMRITSKEKTLIKHLQSRTMKLREGRQMYFNY